MVSNDLNDCVWLFIEGCTIRPGSTGNCCTCNAYVSSSSSKGDELIQDWVALEDETITPVKERFIRDRKRDM